MFKGGTLRLAFMAQDLFQGEKILAFDLETTGVSTNNDRIVQYALIGTLSDGTPVNVEQLVKPRSYPVRGQQHSRHLQRRRARQATAFRGRR